MARKGLIQSNLRKEELSNRLQAKREQLKAHIRDKSLSLEERFESVQRLARLPRNSSRVRVRSRCMETGRPRAVYRFCQLSRIAFREAAMSGHLPGIKRSSW